MSSLRSAPRTAPNLRFSVSIVLLAIFLYHLAARSIGNEYWRAHLAGSVVLGGALWWILFRSGAQGLAALRGRSWWLLLLALSCGVFFRSDLFFYWDEYDVITRFAERGARAALIPHNEHFLPLGMFVYFTECLVFGIHYGRMLLFSSVLHATVALLLGVFLEQLADGAAPPDAFGHNEATADLGRESRRAGARSVALLWLLAGSHVESMHWAFLQLNLLCELFTFGALIAGIRILRSGFAGEGRTRDLSLLVGCSVSAPLCFGNGLRIPMMVGALILFELIRNHRDRQFAGRGSVARMLIPLVVTVAGSATVAVAYTVAGRGAMPGNPGAHGELSEMIHGALTYLFVGVELGTVLRGLGLFPSLYLEAAQWYAPSWIGAGSFLGTAFTPETFFAAIGVIVSGMLFIAVRRIRFGSVSGASLWFLGHLLIISAFVLPAMARWRLGIFQALAMRYQYNSLSGLSVVLLPLLVNHFACNRNAQETPGCGGGSRCGLPERIFAGWIGYFLVCQLFLISELDYFTSRGRENRAFVNRLREWRMGPDASSESVAKVMPKGMTPSNDPEMVYRVLHFLDRASFSSKRG